MNFGHKKLNFGSFLKSRVFRFNRYLFVILLSPFLVFANEGVIESQTCRGAFTNKTPKPNFMRNEEGIWQAIQVEPAVRQEAQNKLWSMVKNPLPTENLNETLYELVKNGADIYAKDSNGWTPLDYATSRLDLELVQAIDDIAWKTIKGEYNYRLRQLFSLGKASKLRGYEVSDYQRALNIVKSETTNMITNREMEQKSVLSLQITLYLSKKQKKKQTKIDELQQRTIGTGALAAFSTHLGLGIADITPQVIFDSITPVFLGMGIMMFFQTSKSAKEEESLEKENRKKSKPKKKNRKKSKPK